LHDGNGNGNQTCEEEEEEEPAVSLRAFATPLATFFFYWRFLKSSKFENEVILEFCNRQK